MIWRSYILQENNENCIERIVRYAQSTCYETMARLSCTVRRLIAQNNNKRQQTVGNRHALFQKWLLLPSRRYYCIEY